MHGFSVQRYRVLGFRIFKGLQFRTFGVGLGLGLYIKAWMEAILHYFFRV